MSQSTFEILQKGTVLLAIVCLATLLLGKRTAASRHLVLTLGFAGLATLPFMVWFIPVREFSRPTPVAPPSRDSVSRTTAVPIPASPPTMRTQPTPEPPAPEAPFPWERMLIGAWAVGVAGSLLSTSIRLIAARRLVARSSFADHPVLSDAFFGSAESSRRFAPLDLSRALRLSKDVPVPMTLGLIHPVILLPEKATEWPRPTLDAVLRHELAHIRRHDWATMVAARLVRAFYWFHPLVWWAEARLRAESEAAADDLVLLSGTDAPSYAEELITLASNLSGRPTRTEALAVVERGTLKTRIKAILGNRRRGGPVRTRVAMSALVGGLGVLSVLACARLVRGPDTVSDGRYYLANGHWLEILAITDMNGQPRSWNARGQLLREPLPVTGFNRQMIDHDIEGHQLPMTPKTRYVLFRTDMDGDVGLETSLSPKGNASNGTFYDYEGPKGYAYQFRSVFGGSYMIQRFDFPEGITGAIHAWSPCGPYQTYGTLERGDLNMSLTTDASGNATMHATLPAEFSSLQAMGEATAGTEVMRSQMQRYAMGEQSVSFWNGPKKITQVRLVARPVKHVLFRDVPLEPKPGTGQPDDVADLPNYRRATGNVGTFADGTTIRFAGLIVPDDPKSGRWTPDGTPALDSSDLRWLAHSSSRHPVLPDDRTVTAVFRVPKDQFNYHGIYDQSGIAFRLQNTIGIATPEKTDLMAYCLVLNRRSRSSSMLVERALGAYKLVAEHKLERTGDYRAWFVATDPQLSGKPSLHLVLPSEVVGKTTGMDTDIQCLDAQGKVIPWQMRSGPSSGDGEVGFSFTKQQADQAMSVRVSTRPYGYVEFPNVHLWPR